MNETRSSSCARCFMILSKDESTIIDTRLRNGKVFPRVVLSVDALQLTMLTLVALYTSPPIKFIPAVYITILQPSMHALTTNLLTMARILHPRSKSNSA